jgi:hypothetical protein
MFFDNGDGRHRKANDCVEYRQRGCCQLDRNGNGRRRIQHVGRSAHHRGFEHRRIEVRGFEQRRL